MDSLTESEKVSRINNFFFDEFKKRANKGNRIASNPWWNKECSLAQANQRLAFTKLKKNYNRENFEIFNNLKKEYGRIIRKAKWEGWKSFFERIYPKISCQELWRLVKIFKGKNFVKVLKNSLWLPEFIDQ